MTSTASEDVGVFTRSSKPFTGDKPVVNVFTATGLPDSRNGQIPLSADMSSSTSPIGMALDLSSKMKVFKPLQFEEMDESNVPVPALYILNNEGVLVAYWVIYADAVKENIIYQGMTSATGEQPTQTMQTPKSTFGSAPVAQSAFGQSGFPKQSTPAFGAPSTPAPSAFGAPSSFGAASSLGSKSSPWGAPQTGMGTPQNGIGAQKNPFAQAAFGQSGFTSSPAVVVPSSQAPAFGSSGGLGQRPSPWATPSASTSVAASGTAFGKPSGIGAQNNTASPFGTPVPSNSASPFASTSGPSNAFSGFAAKGGFAQAAASVPTTSRIGESAFKSTTPAASFSSQMDIGSSFGGTPKRPEGSGGIYGAPKTETSSGPFDPKGFALVSGWKNENPQKPESSKASQTAGSSLFGEDFGNTLANAATAPATAQSRETAIGEQPKSPFPQTTTPADTPAPAKHFAPATSSNLFGLNPVKNKPTTPVTTSLFGSSKPVLETPKPAPPIIKQEPSDVVEGVNRNLPEAPLPPESVSKTTFTPGTSSASSTGGSKLSFDDTPSISQRQPSPLATDEQSSDSSKSKATVVNDSPLPPDLLPSKPRPSATKVAPEEAPLPAHSESEGLSDEGSGIDVREELSPEPSPKVTPESSFGAANRSPVGERFTNIPRPDPVQGGKSLKGDFGQVGRLGEIGGAPIPPLQPTASRGPISPRSPSPIRPTVGGDFLRPRQEAPRASSAPNWPSSNAQKKAPAGRPTQDTVPNQPPIPMQQRRGDSQQRRAAEEERKRLEEEQELSDREDERIREELKSDVKATLTLEQFLPHIDYVGNVKKEGIPGQIETVYRDINSMIDTLGLNSRSLKAFIMGHEDNYKEYQRERDDLEEPDDWTFTESDQLRQLEDDLQELLKSGRIEDIDNEFLTPIEGLGKDMEKLRAKQNDLKRTIDARTHPEHIEAWRVAPLSAEQSMLRHNLREAFAEFQKTLAKAEEVVTLLRAQLATQNSSKSKGRGGGQNVPTFEAVERTIRKMTTMVEKKSGDIDFLEKQMRKLDLIGSSGSRGSRESSPFVTPPTSARKGRGMPRTPGSSINGNGFHTPRSSRNFRDSFASSMGSMSVAGPSPRKRISDVTVADINRYGVKLARRKEINGLLREVLMSAELFVRPVDSV